MRGRRVIQFDRLRIRHGGGDQERLVRRQKLRHARIAAQALQAVQRGRRRRSGNGRRGGHRGRHQCRQLDRDAFVLRRIAQSGIRTALRHGFQGDRRGVRSALDRQHDAHVLAIGLDRAEVLVLFHLAGRLLRRAQRRAIDFELELVAIHVIAIGDLPVRFQRIGVQRTGRELERDIGVKEFIGMRERNMQERTAEHGQQVDKTNPLNHAFQSPWPSSRDKRASRV